MPIDIIIEILTTFYPSFPPGSEGSLCTGTIAEGNEKTAFLIAVQVCEDWRRGEGSHWPLNLHLRTSTSKHAQGPGGRVISVSGSTYGPSCVFRGVSTLDVYHLGML